MIALLDGDLLTYRTLAATEQETCWDEEEEIWTLSTNLKEAKAKFLDQIDAITRKLAKDLPEPVICLSSRVNFRKEILPTYKANRTPKRKPMGFKPFRDWVKNLEGYKVIEFPKLEADDVMGILATKPGNEDAVIVSDDKDLMSVPCRILRQGELITISREEADRFHLYQTLVGDPADGYEGCPGVGPKTAEKILKKPGELWPHIVAAFKKAGLTEADALVQARVARILRWEDWDYEKKEVKLWTP